MIIRIPTPVYEGEGEGAGAAPDPGAAPAAAAAVDPKAGAGTALDLPPEADDKKIVAPADFPEDWRAKMAGGDKDAAKRLERFKTPADVFKSYTEAEKRLTSGKAAAAEPAPDGEKDPDGLKAWREANGIPADPTGYELPKTVQERLTDADKPVLSSFTEFAHKANLPPQAVQVAASWYVDMQEQAYAAQLQTDKQLIDDVQDQLRAEYGGEYRANTGIAKRFADEAGISEMLEARFPNEPRFGDNAGKKLGSITSLVKSLIDVAYVKYGDPRFAGEEATNRTTSRKEEIEKIRDTQFSVYDSDPKMQAEYLEILKAEDKRRK